MGAFAMPELPEVETVRRGLTPAVLGTRIDKVELRRVDIRFPFPDRFEKRLSGRCVIDVDRRAKYLLFRLDSDETLIVHLGMSG
jgi:formamidopyrimidine-DNA glycosylase